MKWRTDTPPIDKWIAAIPLLPSEWKDRSDLPPVCVKWDGAYWADHNDKTWNIQKWYRIPQPSVHKPS